MIIAAGIGGFHVADMFFQFILIILVLLIVTGIIALFVKRNKRLKRIEQKVDEWSNEGRN